MKAKREKIIEQFKKIWEAGHPEFYNLIVKMCRIHEVKNKGYAKTNEPLSNFMESEKICVPAWQGCLIRLSDKYARLVNLAGAIRKDKTKYAELSTLESIEDTAIDLAVYSLILLILFYNYSDDANTVGEYDRGGKDDK
jgi:hypothetical protein